MISAFAKDIHTFQKKKNTQKENINGNYKGFRENFSHGSVN